jgi:hypothetical protein
MADPPDLDRTDDLLPMHAPPGLQALLEEYRRRYPAFRSGPIPGVETPDPSPHPMMDALLAEYRQQGLL